jgi:1,4-dihydroxy-2-naphthoate octaprenyltransferase
MTPAGRAARPAIGVALDLAAALRPQLWIAAVALFEAGRTAAGPAAGPFAPVPGAVAPALASLLALLGAVHLGNGWRDRGSDRVNRKGGAIAAGRLSGTTVLLAAGGCVAVAGAAAWAPGVGVASRGLLAAAAALGAAYVVPPFELKRRAGLDLGAHALGYGIVAYALGATVAGPLSLRILAGALPYASGIAVVGLLAMQADRAGDAAAGQRTTVVALGPARATSLTVALAFGTAVLGLALQDAVTTLWGFVAGAWLALRPDEATRMERENAPPGGDAVRAIRIAVALQLLFAILLLPRTAWPLAALIVFGAATSGLSRWASGTHYPLDVWSAWAGVSGKRGNGDQRSRRE